MSQDLLYILIAYLLSACCGFIFIPALLHFCKKKHLYDAPNMRKVHHTLIPRLGGISFLPSMAISALAVMWVMASDNAGERLQFSTWSIALLFGCTLIFAMGILDDLIGIDAKFKFLAQVIASSIIPLCGLYINHLYGLFGICELPSYVGIPLTIFIFVFIDNAINLIDGIDGLSASLSILALLGFLYCLQPYHLMAYEVMIAGLLGILTTYLCFNMCGNAKKGTKIFMGDSGSLTLGFILAFLFVKVLAVNTSSQPLSTRSILIAYSWLIIPTFDVVRVTFHRLRLHKPIFKADKSHIHHKLLACSLSQHQALLVIITFAISLFGINILLYDVCQMSLNPILLIDMGIYTLFNICISKRLYVQRWIDFCLSAISLVIFSPLFLIIACAIRWEDGKPAIYRQERIGLGGKPFFIYKFRSMKMDAEPEGPNLLEIEGDKRLTHVGKFLRNHHLDELPQLWNVFKGDMAFIGPRPERKYYIDQIMLHDARYEQLYQIRPGVTSYATLYNGYTDTMEKMLRRLELDLYYLEHRSWYMDAKILSKTFVSIVSGKKF